MKYTLDDHFKNFTQVLKLSHLETIRLQSLIKLHPQINWRDAIGPSQIASKQLLLSYLKDWSSRNLEVVSVGGWIGLTEYLLHKNNLIRKRHVNLELDNLARRVSYQLNVDSKDYISLHLDAHNFNYEIEDLVVINSSCEHIERFSDWYNLIPAGTRCILQSNNMFGIEGHINCHTSLSEFQSSVPMRQLQYAKALDIGQNWTRFTVVGIK